MKIIIINGPNLNLLGKREPEIYGSMTFESYFELLKEAFPSHELVYVQSNHEGDLVDAIHKYGFDAEGIVINAGAYTHTSVAIADAIKAVSAPVIEVHISNVHQRESFRHHSFLSPVVNGIIVGCGLQGYKMAVEQIIHIN